MKVQAEGLLRCTECMCGLVFCRDEEGLYYLKHPNSDCEYSLKRFEIPVIDLTEVTKVNA